MAACLQEQVNHLVMADREARADGSPTCEQAMKRPCSAPATFD
jgi:hypothetical protein